MCQGSAPQNPAFPRPTLITAGMLTAKYKTALLVHKAVLFPEPRWIRTTDPRLKRALLYLLS